MGRSIQKLLRRIDELLQGGQTRSAREIAEVLGVSTRTANRYAARLREEHGAPIEGTHEGYRYRTPFSLRPVRYSERDLFALYAARSVLRPLKGSFLTEQIDERIAELLASIAGRFSLTEIDLRNVLSFHVSGTPVDDLDILFDLLECALRATRIRIDYRSLGAAAPTRRQVDPYALTNRNGVWYLVAHDHRRHRKIHFNVARIEGFRRVGTFEREPEFDLEAHFRGAFSVMKGDRAETVRIRFSAEAARFVREREFHPSQVLHEREDGGVDFEVTVDEPEELFYFARSFGSGAEILAPERLRRRMAEEIRRLHRVYETAPEFAPGDDIALRPDRNI